MKTVADHNEARLKLLRKLYPSIAVSKTETEIINDRDIDAVVVATPIPTHYELVKSALNAGKHVLVEKSMTASRKHALELRDLAVSNRKILMVDHTFVYSGPVRKIKQLICEGSLGDIEYVDSVRINLGRLKDDISVIWDLMAHDVALMLHLLPYRPYSVNAVGISHTDYAVENIAYLTLNYNEKLLAHITSSWISPVKVRRMLIGGTKKMVIYDDTEPSEKVKIYDCGYVWKDDEERHTRLVDYREGDILIPKIDTTEALHYMASDFIASVSTGCRPVSDVDMGVEVVSILEASIASARSMGQEIKL